MHPIRASWRVEVDRELIALSVYFLRVLNKVFGKENKLVEF